VQSRSAKLRCNVLDRSSPGSRPGGRQRAWFGVKVSVQCGQRKTVFSTTENSDFSGSAWPQRVQGAVVKDGVSVREMESMELKEALRARVGDFGSTAAMAEAAVIVENLGDEGGLLLVVMRTEVAGAERV
jgi:hypothetical protein